MSKPPNRRVRVSAPTLGLGIWPKKKDLLHATLWDSFGGLCIDAELKSRRFKISQNLFLHRYDHRAIEETLRTTQFFFNTSNQSFHLILAFELGASSASTTFSRNRSKSRKYENMGMASGLHIDHHNPLSRRLPSPF